MTIAPMSDTAARHRPCPVCASQDRRLLFRQQFDGVAESTPVSGYDVVVCDRCGAGYADGIPDQRAFDRYYREMSKYEYHQREGAESPFDATRLALIADLIAPRLPDHDVRILDVGCATGRLLDELRQRGFPRVTGLDPSPACAATAERLYRIPVLNLTLAELSERNERFDLVIFVGVLEHLEDLTEAFVQLRRILTPGGLVYVEVPDATAFADWPNAPYQDFSTEHINFFAPQSLANLFALQGFSTVWSEQNHRVQSHKTVMSNVSAFFRWSGEESGALEARDEESAQGLERYIASCRADEVALHEKLRALVNKGRPFLVWGVGTHTTRLLATSPLADAPIAAFVESNARYQGKTLHGRTILAPEALRERDEPVLISSRVFQHEIAEQIRAMGCTNELILLYDV